MDLVPGLGARKETGLDRRAKVELFEQIRREYDYGVGTIIGVTRKLGIHRRMVRSSILRSLGLNAEKLGNQGRGLRFTNQLN